MVNKHGHTESKISETEQIGKWAINNITCKFPLLKTTLNLVHLHQTVPQQIHFTTLPDELVRISQIREKLVKLQDKWQSNFTC